MDKYRTHLRRRKTYIFVEGNSRIKAKIRWLVSFNPSSSISQVEEPRDQREMTTISMISSTALFVVGYLGSTRANEFAGWNENSLDVGEDCRSGGGGGSGPCRPIFPEKRGVGVEVEESVENNKPWRPVSRVLGSSSYEQGAVAIDKPWQHQRVFSSCPCDTRYDIIDLGLENYPRYLATARCIPKPCHNKFNQCRLIPYKVYILRQRGGDGNLENEASNEETYLQEAVLPQSLRMKWQMKPIKIAVACVAGEAKKNSF